MQEKRPGNNVRAGNEIHEILIFHRMPDFIHITEAAEGILNWVLESEVGIEEGLKKA